ASDVGAPHHRERLFILAYAPDAKGERLAGQRRPGRGKAEQPSTHGSVSPLPADTWGDYGPAVRRWEREFRPAPPPTEPNGNGRPRLSVEFASWMMGLPAGHVTDPAIGISRADQLKAIGNGVCP